jgi:hypothetical protein
MAFEAGNELWKRRSKHGRAALFASPELLWDAACEYFGWCDENPWKEKDWVGKDADEVYREKTRPYTLAGLCVYCGASRHWWNEFRKAASSDFLEVVTRVEEIIYQQKFEGATVGVFNANIISRDLGLVDKKENNLIVEQPLFPEDV